MTEEEFNYLLSHQEVWAEAFRKRQKEIKREKNREWIEHRRQLLRDWKKKMISLGNKIY